MPADTVLLLLPLACALTFAGLWFWPRLIAPPGAERGWSARLDDGPWIALVGALTGLLCWAPLGLLARRGWLDAELAMVAAIAAVLAASRAADLAHCARARRAQRLLTEVHEELDERMRQQARQLDIERRRMGALIRVASDGYVMVDRAGRILELNTAAEALLGCSAAEAAERSLLDALAPLARPRSQWPEDEFEAWVAARGARLRFDQQLRRCDGSELPVEVAIARLRDERGAPFAIFLRDISERRRAKAALEAARDAAEAGSRAKSSFLATISHEIRTPMNAIIGMLELLSMTRLEDRQRETVALVREASASLLVLIDDVLDFSKIEAGKLSLAPEPFAIADLARNLARVFEASAREKGVRLDCHIDGLLEPTHLVDGHRLRQILSNFLSNAVKFTRAGSVVLRVAAEPTELGPRGLRQQRLRISVSDTGIGMAPDTVAKLFQPFEQADSATTREFGGTGLGLAISRRIADLMGARIDVQSRLGTGTQLTLTVELAVVGAPAVNSLDPFTRTNVMAALGVEAAGGAPDAAVAAEPDILVVDDHPTNLRLLRQQLRVLGHGAECAENGQRALDAFGQRRWRLVISDCQMPGMDGYQFARLLREHERIHNLPRTPLLGFTANSHREALDACLAAGMDDVLTKPAELAGLRAKLDRWLGAPAKVAPKPWSAGGASPTQPLDVPPLDLTPLPRDAMLYEPRRLLDAAGGDAGQLSEVASEFMQSAQADLDAVRSAAAEGDGAALRRAAHRLKGAARVIGAGRLAEAAARIEEQAGIASASSQGDDVAATVPLASLAHATQPGETRRAARIASQVGDLVANFERLRSALPVRRAEQPAGAAEPDFPPPLPNPPRR
ncbi:hybrid sensor histidine kinase/response regulator [Derxia lacustris]|uniref:hybrid sensor histidine kinase/response regulator n=1 Tax=Derxia lacustris TaxID=764842 RepID=UPI001592EF9A|nr:ATP-binding protein [Derxia lacustris]